jgi:hypothetical protein
VSITANTAYRPSVRVLPLLPLFAAAESGSDDGGSDVIAFGGHVRDAIGPAKVLGPSLVLPSLCLRTRCWYFCHA